MHLVKHRSYPVKSDISVEWQALASELAPKIRVNSVNPGFVPTNFADYIIRNPEAVSLFTILGMGVANLVNRWQILVTRKPRFGITSSTNRTELLRCLQHHICNLS